MIATTNCRHGVPPAECERCQRVAQLTETLQAMRQPSVCRHGLTLGQCEDCAPMKRRPVGLQANLLDALQAAALPLFKREDLVMFAWERWPLQFGLRDHQHPDSARVYSLVDGKRGLVARGWLRKREDGLYELTAPATKGGGADAA